MKLVIRAKKLNKLSKILSFNFSSSFKMAHFYIYNVKLNQQESSLKDLKLISRVNILPIGSKARKHRVRDIE